MDVGRTAWLWAWPAGTLCCSRQVGGGRTHYRPSSVSVWVPRGCGSAGHLPAPCCPGRGCTAAVLSHLGRLAAISAGRRTPRDAGPRAQPQQWPVGEADHSQGHQEGRRWLPRGTCVRPVLPCRPSQRARLTHRPSGGTSLIWQKGCSAHSHAQSRASASPRNPGFPGL